MAYGHKDGCPHPGYPCNCEGNKMSKTDFKKARDEAIANGNWDYIDGFTSGADWARKYCHHEQVEFEAMRLDRNQFQSDLKLALKALEFYGKERNDPDFDRYKWVKKMQGDLGYMAEQALKKLNGESDEK